MKISELQTKGYLIADDATGRSSYMLVNAPELTVDPEDENLQEIKTVTHKVNLEEFVKMGINIQKIITYDTTEGNMLNSLEAGDAAYNLINIGQFITAADRTTINNIQAGFADDNDNDENTPVNWDTSYVKSVTQTNGVLAVQHATFTPSLNPTAGTPSDAQKLNITVGGNSMAQPIELTKATEGANGIYGVTKLLTSTESTSESVAATPKAVTDALTAAKGYTDTSIQALDVDTITTNLAASKTITALSQTNGVIAATASDIAIANTQVSGLGTASVLDVAATGDANSTQVVKGDDTRLTDSRNAADVPAWAKAANKPAYNITELTDIPALPTTNGTYILQVVISGNTATYSWVAKT